MKLLGTNLSDKTQVIFENVLDAARYLNLDESHIRKCLKGTRKSHGGYSWKLENISDSKLYSLNHPSDDGSKTCLGGLANSDKALFSDLNFSPEKWTKKEDAVLLEMYPNGNLEEIVKKISKDIVSITMRAKVLGLKRKENIFSNNRSCLDLVNIVVDSKEEISQ